MTYESLGRYVASPSYTSQTHTVYSPYRRHNTIEHDASLSRLDLALGDSFSFNEKVYKTLASSNPGVDYYNATSAGWTMQQTLKLAKKANKKLKNTSKEFTIRSLESVLYLVSMGDVATGKAPKKYVHIHLPCSKF